MIQRGGIKLYLFTVPINKRKSRFIQGRICKATELIYQHRFSLKPSECQRQTGEFINKVSD